MKRHHLAIGSLNFIGAVCSASLQVGVDLRTASTKRVYQVFAK